MREGNGCIISPNIRWRYPDLVQIGDHCILDDYTYVSAALWMGSYSHIGPNCTIYGGRESVVIGSFVDIGPGVRIISASTDYTDARAGGPCLPDELVPSGIHAPVGISDHVVIGANVVILPGSTIPEGCAIGANSLVTHETSLEEWSVFAGTPARFFRHRKNKMGLRFQMERLKSDSVDIG